MSKPIEVGCTAVIEGSIHPERNGTVVTVLFYGFDHDGERTWIVDTEFVNPDGIMTDRCPERLLRRLDDDNAKELCTTWEDMEDLFVPDALKEKVYLDR